MCFIFYCLPKCFGSKTERTGSPVIASIPFLFLVPFPPFNMAGNELVSCCGNSLLLGVPSPVLSPYEKCEKGYEIIADNDK